jgi:hypothetical protein
MMASVRMQTRQVMTACRQHGDHANDVTNKVEQLNQLMITLSGDDKIGNL